MEDSLALWRAGGRVFPGNSSVDLVQIHNMLNRPFDGGGLFRRIRGGPLTVWAAEISCKPRVDYSLQFIVLHPHAKVTCAIPATSKAAHMAENMNALPGELPDAGMPRQMAEYGDNA
jgi:diketogulonate reductase-like aldo/keto reductase